MSAKVVTGWLLSSEPKPHASLAIELGWLALVLPIAGAAITYIVRAFAAENRVRQECNDLAVDVRESTVSADVRPTLASIIVSIHPYMDWPTQGSYLPGEAGDPEIEAARILGYQAATFSDAFTSLEEHYTKIHRANSVHGSRVAHARRCGIAMSIFLVTWGYIGVWLILPALNFPSSITFGVVTLLAGSAGWAACEWWSSNQEMNNLSVLAREARQRSGGKT